MGGVSGFVDGSAKAIEEYINGWKSTLSPTEYYKLLIAISEIPSKMKSGEYSAEKVKAIGTEFYEIVANLDQIVAGLDDYTKNYYKGYVSTSVGLEMIPVKTDKLTKLRNIGIVSETMGKVKLLNKSSKPWTATKDLSSVENAYEHWIKHGGDFENIKNSKE